MKEIENKKYLTSYFEPYTIVSYGSVDIAYIAITTPETINSSSPAQFKNDKGELICTFNESKLYDIVSSINPNDSEYEKELAIHDYLTQTTKYDKNAQINPFANGVMDSAYDAYAVIVEKRGVCNGYTDAFQYLCYMVGINSNVVFGNAHIWNNEHCEGE